MAHVDHRGSSLLAIRSVVDRLSIRHNTHSAIGADGHLHTGKVVAVTLQIRHAYHREHVARLHSQLWTTGVIQVVHPPFVYLAVDGQVDLEAGQQLLDDKQRHAVAPNQRWLRNSFRNHGPNSHHRVIATHPFYHLSIYLSIHKKQCYTAPAMPFLTDEQLNERAVSGAATGEERVIENELRPRSLTEFIGQDHLKDTLGVFLRAANLRQEALDHVLLYGNPGLGKTTLAHIIAAEMGRSCKVTSGPALERAGDLAAVLTGMETGDVLFIDEIHRLNRSIEEVLYPALEDYALDLTVGKGPGAQSLRMQLNKFTLIGATTRPSLLSAPLRDRFGATFHLEYYTQPDMEKIIQRSAKILNINLDAAAASRLAVATRATPRVANRLLRRVRDVAQVENAATVTEEIITRTLDMLQVDHLGLDHGDRKILRAIVETFRGGPVGVATLAAAVAEEIETLETVHEPYLLQIGLLERTPKGRIATPAAYTHLKFPAIM